MRTESIDVDCIALILSVSKDTSRSNIGCVEVFPYSKVFVLHLCHCLPPICHSLSSSQYAEQMKCMRLVTRLTIPTPVSTHQPPKIVGRRAAPRLSNLRNSLDEVSRIECRKSSTIPICSGLVQILNQRFD